MGSRRWLVFLILSLILITQCKKSVPADGGRIPVSVSIAPLADLTRKVGAELIDIFTIVPQGANPHTFELTPEIMRRIVNSRILILNGVGLEFWADDILDVARDFDLHGVVTSEGLDILQDDDHAAGNPHVWLNPHNAMHQVRKIRDAMVKIDPQKADFYRENADNFLAELTQLDQELEDEIATWKHRQFICFHPSWDYFARRYGLIQAAVIEKRPGYESSPQELGDIIETARELHVQAIFSEIQFPDKMSRTIAEEVGIRIIPLDPLGKDMTYVELLRFNVQHMAKALK